LVTELTLVFGYRDREPERVQHCLDSLARQTIDAFRAIVVDYGSQTEIAVRVQQIVRQHAFAQYIYNDMRGRPWNRAHALNVGIRQAHTNYVMTSDIDMVFAPHFLETVLAHVDARRVIYVPTHWLPKGFDDWPNVHMYAGKLPQSHKTGLGGNMTVHTQHLEDIRGFDEYYRYWGREDNDLHHRLVNLTGLEECWLDAAEAPYFHQWHPTSFAYYWSFPPRHFTIPASVWGQANVHYIRELGQTVRNSPSWGKIYTVADRLAANYIDFDRGQMKTEPTLVYDVPYSDVSREQELMAILHNMKPGESLLIPHGRRPEKYRLLTHVLRLANRVLTHFGTEIDYSPNALHDFLAWFLLVDEHLPDANHLIADYYLGLQQHDNASVLIRSKNTPMAHG
jgi:hypothetical protein